MLDAPWPNPARGDATLRFAARTGRPADLSIYDVSGRRVARVGTGEPGDGIIRLATWDTRTVAPGVYFAVLRSGRERLARKIVVRR
jgi:hypothetical protein